MRTRLAVVIGVTLLITIIVCSWLVRGEAKFFVETNRLSDAAGFASASHNQNLEFAVIAFESPGESDTTPVDAVDDSYTVHISDRIGPFSRNDSGPNGPGFDSYRVLTLPAHGTLNPDWNDTTRYTHETGFTGTDSFTYEICEAGDCDTATVTITVVNLPPVAVDDRYEVTAPYGRIGIFSSNDDDTDDSAFAKFRIITLPAHGRLEPETSDAPLYYPDAGYSGPDSLVYEVCDVFNACSTATVYINDDGKNAGVVGCNKGIGEPINVTNGNTYLQQTDYQLPGVGQAIEMTRTYNSSSLHVNLFGLGWSSAYDEAVTQFSSNNLRLLQPDGRAVDFIRLSGTSNTFKPIQEDFRGQILWTGSGYTLNLKIGEVHEFGAYGKLLSLTDRNNNRTSLAYDTNGNLASVTDPFGRTLSVTSNPNGRVLSIADGLGTIASYTYGGSDELLSVTYADNSRFQFGYDASHHLTSVSDALGNIVESHSYDSNGRGLTSERHGGVERYVLNYVSDAETNVTDALGRFTKYTVDKTKGRNLVTQVEGLCSCGSSQVQTWTYDSQLNLTAKSNAFNHTTTFTYDANGNRLTETDTTGTVAFTYNQLGEVLTATDQLNGVTSNTYDASGNLLTTTNALGKTTSFSYDSRGLLLTITDARGKVTSFAYDSSGNLTSKTDALSHATQFGYDARSRLTSVSNSLGHVTAFAYDGVGRTTQVTQPDGTHFLYEYDLGGRRTATIDSKGNRTTYAYDGANRLTTETDALSQSTSYTYDSMSNLTTRFDALGRVTDYEYDDFNRLVKVTHPAATLGAPRLFEMLAYDAVGNVWQRTDTAGRTTFYGYTSESRLDHTTDADNQLTLFNYDAVGRLTAVIDAQGQRYRFNYDDVGQLRHIRRGSTVMSFSYDAVGNRKQRTDYNGALTTYVYDSLNRLKTINYPDASTVAYTYDKLSRLQTATNEHGTVDFDYNKMNRLSSVTDVFDQVVEHNYDANGNRTKLTLNSATAATYRYDAGDRLTKIIDAAGTSTNYSYDVTNKLLSRRLPNGILTSYTYDDLDRLTRLRDAKGASTVADHLYQYNTASQITQIAEPTNTRSYGYDAVDRLTSANYTNPVQPTENYAHDGVGNRTSSHLSATYSYQPFNKLTSTGSVNYSYDVNGNLTAKTDAQGTWTYSWDFENRLTRVVKPDGASVSYEYDALGRRIRRVPSAGVSNNFVYDGQDVLRDLNSDGSTVDYLNGPGIDNKLRLTDSRLATGPLYFLQDQLGSTTALTNSSGGITEQVTYDAYGNSTGTSLTRYDYTGRERDPDTGLLYYRARWYDPEVGRFISEDPIGFAGGINQFAYVGNNPQNATDPQGLWPSQLAWKVHQAIIRRALASIGVPQGDIRILAREQGPFDMASQEASQAHMHAMCRPGESPADCRRRANQFIREQICRAKKLAARGNRGGALKLLSRAMHTLQDSTSPAHANFQEAWPNTYKEMAKHSDHYYNEWFDPGAGSEADSATIRAWRYFKDQLEMPADFFGDLFDLPRGQRGYFYSKPSPDGSNCDCYD